jgi:transcriptional regulator with XRE-family HTH domain
LSTTTTQEELDQLRRNAPLPLIGARIKRARKARGLSHDRLGEACGGVSRQHLIKLEKGKHRPTLDMLERIGGATGRDVRWFLDPEVDPSPFPGDVGNGDRRDA